MTNPNYTAIVLVVDRSGSMSSIAASVQETLEEFVNAQLALPGELTIDTVFFDDKIENRAELVNPKDTVLDLALEPRGMTALYDAVGMKIDSFGKRLSSMAEAQRPGKVIFVIATDGHENSSKEITQSGLAHRIAHQREKYGWDFTFIGANQDALLTAKGLNIPVGSAITFEANPLAASNVLRSMSTYVESTRSGLAASYSLGDREAALANDQSDAVKSAPVKKTTTAAAAPKKRAARKPKSTS